MKKNGTAPVLLGTLPRRDLHGGSTQVPALSEKQLQPVSPSRTWLHSGYFHTLEITTSWFSSSSLPECLSTLHNLMLFEIYGSEDCEKQHLYFLSSANVYFFPAVRCLWSHFEERTNEIVLRMVEAQKTQGSLWHQGRQLMESCDSAHATHPEATTKNVLWALLYRDSPVHTEPKCTQPIWAGQCTQEDLKEENLPFDSNIHTYCCTSCIFWC